MGPDGVEEVGWEEELLGGAELPIVCPLGEETAGVCGAGVEAGAGS